MTMKAFRVDTETLDLIDRYLKSHPDGIKTISEVICKAITTLNEAEDGKHQMLIEAPTYALSVIPKKDYVKVVTKKYGKNGPYKVDRTVKSFTQVSDGFYTLKGSENLYPTEWFELAKPTPPQTPSLLATLPLTIIWGVLIFTLGYALSAMHFMYLIMLL